MLYCKDCKYCQLNQKFMPPKTKGFFGIFKRFKAYLDYTSEREIMLATSLPKCLHPEVYKENMDLVPVFGEESREKMSCEIARNESTPNSRFHCCGKEAKYFEKK